MKHNRLAAATSLLATAAVALSGCNTHHTALVYASGAKVECGGKQGLAASGSTAQAPAMTQFINAFHKTCPGRTLSYSAIGSGAGISEFLAGKTDLVDASLLGLSRFAEGRMIEETAVL